MTELVNVEGTELSVREYNGQMVVTFDDIDLVHKRPHGTARNAFKRNKRHFIDGVDYFVLEKENSNVHETYIRIFLFQTEVLLYLPRVDTLCL